MPGPFRLVRFRRVRFPTDLPPEAAIGRVSQSELWWVGLREAWSGQLGAVRVRPMARTDAELVSAMTRGDQAALGELYERHLRRVLFVVRSILGDAPLVADVAQDVFLEAWRSAGSYDAARGTVQAWLVVRARSRALDVTRSKAHKSRVDFDETSSGGYETSPTDAMYLPRALGRITEQEREVLLLGYFEDLSSAQIAERLAIPVGTVKSRTRTALNKLSAYFAGRKP